MTLQFLMIMDLGNEHQWPPKSQKEKQEDLRCLLVEDDSTYPDVLLNKTSENKKPGNKFNQRGEGSICWKLQDVDGRNQRRHK